MAVTADTRSVGYIPTSLVRLETYQLRQRAFISPWGWAMYQLVSWSIYQFSLKAFQQWWDYLTPFFDYTSEFFAGKMVMNVTVIFFLNRAQVFSHYFVLINNLEYHWYVQIPLMFNRLYVFWLNNVQYMLNANFYQFLLELTELYVNVFPTAWLAVSYTFT